MNYYIDTEFLEGSQNKRILGIKTGGKTKPTIDLISIGIVSEDGREYYAVSKDFNLKEAWNRYDLIDDNSIGVRLGVLPSKKKVYWIRDNVLLPIYKEYISGDMRNKYEFTYSTMKWLLKSIGKSNEKIGEEIKVFCKSKHILPKVGKSLTETKIINPKFFTYYGAYDHVAFCWLFGKMIDLPKGFPMYSIDLKQIIDEKVETMYKESLQRHENPISKDRILKNLKESTLYPNQENLHNALSDAKWNMKLHKFLKQI